MSDWSALDDELARWRAAGQVPTLWWRDDDVQAPSGALDRLIALAERAAAPLHLAAIPRGMDRALAAHLQGHAQIRVLQHGFAHINHASAGERASEFGASRAEAAMAADLASGWTMLQDAGLPDLLPVLAAPWNRVGDHLPPLMPALGYRVLSASHPRSRRFPVRGLEQVNIHIDPIRWKGGARFRGETRTLRDLIEHLGQRRTGVVDRDEPTGINTHHLQTCSDTWAFLERLMPHLTDQGVVWLCLKEHLSNG